MRCCIIFFFSLVCITAFSQTGNQPNKTGKITGKVIDSISHQGIEDATVSLYLKGSSSAINGTTTKGKGQFTVNGVVPGIYTVVIDFIEYKKTTISDVTISDKSLVTNIGAISLLKTTAQLQGVVVTAQAKVIENKIDKMVFNAEKDLTSQGGVATDVLKKVPQVAVDVDGNVELAGSTSIQFLINGKPSTAFGNNIADVLQSIPASQIKSIEVITNPGAKYDAEGLGGIINIILKESNAQGINGNLSVTAGTLLQNGSLNFNARKGTFGLHAFASSNVRLTATTPNNSGRVSIDTPTNTKVDLLENGSSRFRRHGVESGIGFDWTYKKRNSFSGSVNYDNFGNNSTSVINQNLITSADDGVGGILSNIASINNTASSFLFHNVDATLDYKRTFAKEDEEFDVSVNSSFGHNNAIADNYLLNTGQNDPYYGTNSVNPGAEHETSAQIDYSDPLKKDVIFGIGSKFDTKNINSVSNVSALDPSSKNYLYDTSLSNSLTYKQQVYAFYSEITFPVSTWFNVKAGGRYERTEINSYFSNASTQATTPGYNSFVPSIFFMRKLNDNQTLKLSYSKRIQRPDYRDLNPFLNTIDPQNFTTGNPFLKPEIANRFELSYTYDLNSFGSFMVTAFYRTSNHDIQPYIVYHDSLTVGDTTYKNVAVSTSQNIGLEQDAGLNLFADLHFTSKFSIRTNMFFFHRYTINAINPGLNATSFNYRLNINASYQFSKTLAGEFFGNFNSARNEVQGKYPSFTSYNFAFRKQIWNKKGSLALTATNPFSEYVDQRTILYGPGFSQNALRKVPFRSFGINFTWKFGRLEFKKDKNDGGDNGGGGGGQEGQ